MDWFSKVDWTKYQGAALGDQNALVMSALVFILFAFMWLTLRFVNLVPTFWFRYNGFLHRSIGAAFALAWVLQLIAQVIGIDAASGRSPAQYELSTILAKHCGVVNFGQLLWLAWIASTNAIVRAAIVQLLDPRKAGTVYIVSTRD